MTPPFPSLNLGNVSEDHPVNLDNILGAVTYGNDGTDFHPASFGAVPIPVLPKGGVVHSAWFAEGPFVRGSYGSLQFRHNDNVLFGFIALNENDFPPTIEASSLQQVAFAVYSSIFSTIKATPFRNLVRCWNYLPRINEADCGMERYRHFNIGRQDAFIRDNFSYLAGSPSACALGSVGSQLVVYFMSSRAAPVAVENPRQISAYNYPSIYGPRSPNFSRATLLQLPRMEVLFISGTASIIGHKTVHHSDVEAQTAETLRNLEIIVEQSNLKSRLGGFTTRNLFMKVFIRHAKDFEKVVRLVRKHFGDSTEVTWLQADICRSELLVEIEAFGFCEDVAS